MTTETENQEVQTPEDEFAAAFAELTLPAKAQHTEEETDADEAEAGVEGGESPADEVVEGEQGEAGAEPAEEVATEPTGESAFAQELAKLREEIAKPSEPTPAAPAAEPAVSETPAAAPTSLQLTEEEQKVLAEYEKDWPDISKAEAIKRKQEIYAAVQFVFSQMAGTLNPIVEKFKESEYSQHEAAIKGVHEDYDDVRDDVIKWATSQTGLRGKLFTEVVQSGTAEEIADLVSTWKEVHGKTKPQVVTGAGSPTAPTEPPAKAKQAAQKLSVVSSKRTAVPAAQDPNDFDSAWSEATGKS